MGQTKRKSIVELRKVGEIMMVSLVSKTNIPQTTCAKWHGERLILNLGMSEEEMKVPLDGHAVQRLGEDKLVEAIWEMSEMLCKLMDSNEPVMESHEWVMESN